MGKLEEIAGMVGAVLGKVRKISALDERVSMTQDELDYLMSHMANLEEGGTKIRFGFRRAKNVVDPSDRIEYLYDAVGKTPAGMVYDSNTHAGTFNYGDWEDFVNSVARPNIG